MRQTNPDKRVPAELVQKTAYLLRCHFARWEADQLESCPDIVDEPATLHQTAQAVLDAADALRSDECTDNDVCDTVEVWRDAGRPTVVHDDEYYRKIGLLKLELEEAKKRVSSPEDAATLAALHECRELGLCVVLEEGCAQVIDANGKSWTRNTLPDARDAYKAAPVKVKDGWYWTASAGLPSLVREVRAGHVLDCWTGNPLGRASAFIIGPECPPPPNRDRLPDRPEGDE